MDDALDPAESRRQAVQAELDAAKSATERNRLGQFATPFALAVEIARFVKAAADDDLPVVRFADPSVGTGSFYSAARAVFGAGRIERAVGVELDPAFANAARRVWAGTNLDLESADFTRLVAGTSRPAAPNLILANPPYVRHHHIGREDKERLHALVERLTGVNLNGLAGLYTYFLLAATAWLEDGGYAAWLIPSEFMDVNYGAALKRFLTDRVTLIRVHRFAPDDVQFGDALVSSAVLVFRKAIPPAGHAVEFSYGGSISEPQAVDALPAVGLRDARKWTAYPAHAGNDRLVSEAAEGPTLSDLFRVQRGIATGSTKFFVLDRAEAVRRGFPSNYFRPILPSPRVLKDTVVESEADGYPRLDPQLCMIDCDLSETVVADRHQSFWEYLRTGPELGVTDGYLVGKRSPWYKQERREPAPFLCTYMGRGADEKRPFRFIWNQSRAVATNLYLMLYPRERFARMLRDHPDRAAEVFAMLGRVTGHELRGEGRVYGGGLNKIEPSELGRISAAAFAERWPELAPVATRQGSLFE